MGGVGRAVVAEWEGSLVYAKKMIPPDNVFACKTHKCILPIEDSQTKGTLRNIEWGPALKKVGFSQGS